MKSGQLSRISDWENLAREAKFHPVDMAALCPSSLRQMQRFFAARFGMSPCEWARQSRCRLARQLISEGWSSKAVIFELGFTDGSHLGREFRRFYGARPQAFAPIYQFSGAPGSVPRHEEANCGSNGKTQCCRIVPDTLLDPRGMSRIYPNVAPIPGV